MIALLHWRGIPAANETLYFFFSGPRLFPTLSPWNIVAALVIVMLVTVLSTLYPAFLATRVAAGAGDADGRVRPWASSS